MTFIKAVCYSFLLVCLGSHCWGEGKPIVLAKTYAIHEDDLLEYIKNRVHSLQQTGEWQRIKEVTIDKAKKRIIRPYPLRLSTALHNNSWTYDPSITMTYNILDDHGNIITKAGEKINPLKVVSLNQPLIFFNGDDDKQVNFVLHQKKIYQDNVKLILTAGAIDKANTQFSQPIYFDQKGLLTTKFNIKHVPAIVTQENDHLLIREMAV